MRPSTIAQSLLLASTAIALPAVLQPRQSSSCSSILDLSSDISALEAEIKAITSPDLISDIETIVSQIFNITGDIELLSAGLSCFLPTNLLERDSAVASENEMPAIEARQTPSVICNAAAAVNAEIASLTTSVEGLLSSPSLSSSQAAPVAGSLNLTSLLLPGC